MLSQIISRDLQEASSDINLFSMKPGIEYQHYEKTKTDKPNDDGPALTLNQSISWPNPHHKHDNQKHEECQDQSYPVNCFW